MDGAMASRIVFPAAYAHRVELEPRAAALVEPTSVAVHAVRRGAVRGKGVLVVGAGPIGLLCAQVAVAEGAAHVAVSDTRPDRVTLAASLGFPALPTDYGASGTWGAADAAAAIAAEARMDWIDVAILCAGGERAIRAAFEAVRPGGTVVALGLSGTPTVPFDFDGLVVRDIDLIGVLGSVGYWEDAIRLVTEGKVRTEPLVTRTFPLERTRDALEHLVSPGTLKVLIEP